MKAAAVSLGTLRKHKRWDASYYLGRVEDKEADVAKAEQNLEVAAKRLLAASTALVDEIHRAKQLELDGEVIPLTGDRGI